MTGNLRQGNQEGEGPPAYGGGTTANAPVDGRGLRRTPVECKTYNQMVVDLLSRPETDRVFHALADATRRDIVRTVLVEVQSVSALARRYPMSVAAVQKHVAVLEEAGLVTKQRQGRESLVSGDIERVRDARSALDAFEQLWRDRVAQMDQILAEDP